MKILSVGDIHGKPIWKDINPKEFDKVYFTGDWYDAWEYTNNEIHSNVLEWVQWAKEAGNVFSCIGNHDAHYFKWQEPIHKFIRSAGYSANQLYRAFHLYIENRELFNVAYQHENYLWTHAGLSVTAYGRHIEPHVLGIMQQQSISTLAEVLNYLWNINYMGLFAIPSSRGGDDLYGGPLWADMDDTIGNPLTNFHQIVGHTASQDIIHKEMNDETSITYIDCLNYKIGKFYEIDI